MLGMHGALLVDKPSGPTSHDVVAFTRRLLKTPRVGHTGTLDPLATGLLVLLVGHATRLSRFLVTDEKEYIADVRLGIATPTYDAASLATRRRLDARCPMTDVDARSRFEPVLTASAARFRRPLQRSQRKSRRRSRLRERPQDEKWNSSRSTSPSESCKFC